mgnify:CR=1 FL=1
MTEFTLPKGWLVCNLADIGNIQTGNTPPKNQPDLYGHSFPIFKPGDLDAGSRVSHASEYLSEAGRAASRFVPAGSTYVTCIGATIGKTGLVVVDGTCNQQINTITPEVGLNQKWMFYWICSPMMQNAIISNSSSTTLPILNKSKFSSLETIVPPLAEQQQIAQKLDELLAQVDTLKTRLDAIPNILKRFRQSVLAAAVSGKLTEEWREIQIEKLDEWRWVTLGEIADVKGGITKDSKKQESSFIELPYLRVANVQRYFLDLDEIKTIRIPETRVKDLLLEVGDILFNEGGDLDKLGRGWIWEGQIQNCSYQNHVFRARLKNKSDSPKYISWWGNTEGFEYFIRNGKQTTNLASINKTLLSNLPINLPPTKEQTEIVRRVEQLFAYADQIEQRVKDAQARVNHLTQSILAKAFRGELTAEWRAQNPELISGENSAAALLERIKAERGVVATKKRVKK